MMVETKELVAIEAPILLGLEPVSVLRVLRNHYNNRSMALCRSSVSEEDSFLSSHSMIGLDPLEVVQVRNQDPFSILQEKISHIRAQQQPNLPSFQGGVLGYISYDAVRFYEPSLVEPKKDYSSNEYDAEFVLYRMYIVFDYENKKVFLYHTDSTQNIQTRVEELKKLEGFALEAKTNVETNYLSSGYSDIQSLSCEAMTSGLGKPLFLAAVEKLKHHILEGDIFQAVISDHFSTPFPYDSLDLFSALSQISPAPYQFYFTIDDRAFLGASPEMLLKITGDEIETHPIAGTRPRGKTVEEENQIAEGLLSDVKEKAEHLMLVDLARNDIGRVSRSGSVEVKSLMKVRKFGGVMHLVSKVIGKIREGANSIEALASCFPAGTLSGAPKIRAMDLITEIEQARRGFYGGAFVVASATGDLDSCISIRSISVANAIAKVQAGAGIVADSVAENEYAEIQHKSRLTRRAIALCSKGSNRI